MKAFTDFGDTAVLLPLSIVILVWLLSGGLRRVVGSWIIAIGLCIAGTALLKIYMYGRPPAPDLVSPSGHSSLSVLIYGAITLIIAAEQRGCALAATLVAGASWIVAIAGSRLLLRAHSAPEVGIGIIIGVATLTLFTHYYLCSRSEGRRLLPVILSVIVVTAVLHGQELPAEALLQVISRHLHITRALSQG